MNGPETALTIERFADLLDAFGGDTERWPAHHIDGAKALLLVSADARRLHAEARALDTLLAKASSPDPARIAFLADRIAAAAGCPDEGIAAAPSSFTRPDESGKVIRLPDHRSGGNGSRLRAKAPRPETSEVERRRAARWPWGSAAALAASLMLGVAIGFTDLGPATTVTIAGLADPASEAELVLSALQLDGLGVLDEDAL